MNVLMESHVTLEHTCPGRTDGHTSAWQVIYKQQGSAVIDVCHEGTNVSVELRCQESDFLFGLMDEVQCETKMLR